MKSLVVMITCCALVLAQSAAAQDEPLLGRYHGGLEFDYMLMQHRTFDFDDAGLKLLMKGYGHVGNDWYVGGEISVGGNIGLILTPDVGIVTLEANGKRAFRLSRHLVCDLGAGVSYTDAEIYDRSWFSFIGAPDVRVEDSVLGFQVLADLFLQIEWAMIGLSVKQTVTQDIEGFDDMSSEFADWDVSNLTFGLQAGFRIPER